MAHLANEVRPDFILNTGDLVTRYHGPGNRPLPLETIRRQIRAAYRVLSGVRIPQFLTPGNHDVAFPGLRTTWTRLMGRRWDGGTDDYRFDYRGVCFLAVDRSVEYDAAHRGVSFGMGPEQRRWLEHELERTASARMVIVFCHYDYRRELVPLLARHPVTKVFYGHSNTSWVPAELAHVDGQLLSCYAYQTVTVSPRGVTQRPGLTMAGLLRGRDGVRT
jgi:3',5'-cyclic AMP phosphodiesterase CpdA